MTEVEIDALKEEIKQEIKAEIKTKKKSKKRKSKEEESTQEEGLQGLYYTKGEPRKAFSTYLRNQNKFYVNSLNVIDRKASMMIRVNSTIISGIVLFFEYVQDIEYGTLIGVVMVIFSFASLMLALNASKPYVISMARGYKARVAKKYPKMEENLFAIGMHNKASLEEYEQAFDQLVKSQELQIGSQVRAMYAFEKQISLAFLQIDLAFGSFIIGFLITVVVFLYGVISGLF